MPRKRSDPVKSASAKQTQEQKCDKAAERMRKLRARLTEEERTLQRVQAAERKRAQRARLTEEQRTLQRVQDAVRKKEKASLTEEERALQRAKDAERYRIRKGLLTKRKSTYESPKPPEGSYNNNTTEIKSSLVGPQQPLQRREQQTTNLPADDSQSEETRNTLLAIQNMKIMVQSLRNATLELVKSTVKATVERVKGITIEPSHNIVRIRNKVGIKVPGMKSFSIRLPNTARGSATHEYVCPVCPEMETYSKLLTHLQRHTKTELEIAREKLNKEPPGRSTELTLSMYPCELCPDSFFQINRFRKHMVDSHKDNRDLLGKYCYLCSFCDEAYSFKKSLISHERDIHGIYTKCPICNASIQTQQLYTEHIDEVHRDCSENEMCLQYSEGYICKMCGYIHRLKRRVMEHFQNTHSLRSLKCDVCEKMFASERNVLIHKRTRHGGKSFFCEKCGKNCKDKQSFEHHVNKHNGQNHQVFKCKNCHKSFATTSGLKSHHRSSHTTETPFQCHICGKAFSLSSSLFHHKINYCEKDQAQKRTCSICEKVFDNSLLLSYHKNNIHKFGNAEETICNRCSKTTASPCALYLHNKMHHESKGNSQLMSCICHCKVCGKEGKCMKDLFNHWRTHNKEKPFKCSLCGTEYKSHASFYQHKKIVHAVKNEMPKIVVDREMNERLRAEFRRLHSNELSLREEAGDDEIARTQTVSVESGNFAEVSELEFPIEENSVPELVAVDGVTGKLSVFNDKNLQEMAEVIVATEMNQTVGEEFQRLDPILSSTLLWGKSGEDEVPATHAVAVATGTYQPTTTTINIAEVSEMELGVTVELSGKESNNVATGTESAAVVMEKTYVDFSRANIPELSKMVTNSRGRRKQNLLPFNDVDIMSGQSVSEIIEIELDYNPVSVGGVVGGEYPESTREIHEAIDFDEFNFTPGSPMSIYFDEKIFQDEIKYIISPPEPFPDDPYHKKLIIKLERLKENTCSACDFVTYTSENYEKHLSSRAHRRAKRSASYSRFLNTNSKENCYEGDESYLSYSSDESVSSSPAHSKSSYQKQMMENRIKNLRKPRVYVCSFCGEKLESFTLYKTHLIFHADERFRCEICEVKFETSDELTKHCDEIHEGKMPFQCEECPSGFVALYLLVHHRNRRHNSRDGNNGRKVQIKQKGQNREKRPFCCSKCSWCFKRKDHLNRHIKRFHHQLKRLFSCKTCARGFTTRQYLKEHHKKAHPAEKKVTCPGRRKKLKYVCKICGSEHNDAISMKNHRKTHRSRRRIKQKLERTNPRNSKVHICSFCGETLKDSELYKSHLALHAKEMLKCAFCTSASEFHTSDELAKHCDEIHPGKMPFQCQECPSGFSQVYLLVRHKILRHSQANYLKLKPLKPLEQHGIKIHKLVGHGPQLERPFSCSDCFHNFSSESQLYCHIKEVHQKLKKIFSCKICGQDCTAPLYLARHHKKAHPEEKFEIPEGEEKYMGTICGSEQSDLISISKHRKIHYSERKRKPKDKNGGDVNSLEERSKKLLARLNKKSSPEVKKYMCDICGLSFIRPGLLKNHIKRHEEGNVVRNFEIQIGIHDSKRPFRCDQCSYHFKYSSHLKRHILSIHENMTHACEICSKEFRRKDDLRQHNRKFHSEMFDTILIKYRCGRCNVEFSDSKSLTEHRKMHAGEKEVYKCPQCPNKSYDTQVRLDRHLQLHDSSRPFSCNLCSFFFNHTSNLVLHRKNVHEKMGIDYWSKKNALKRKAKKVNADSLIEK